MTTVSVRLTSAPSVEQFAEPPLRSSTEIQGNILAAFNKDFMTFRYVRFPANDNGAGGRGWLSVMLNTVSVTASVEDFNEEFSLARRAFGQDPSLVATWVGVSLTYQGLLRVAHNAAQVEKDLAPFEAFTQGAAARAAKVGDHGPSAPDHWLFGRKDEDVDAVLIVASDTERALKEKLANIEAADAAHHVKLVYQDNGRTLPGPMRGHEHFGFKDGISQPGVKDFHRGDPAHPGHRENRPGSVLVEPGEFVFGYPREKESEGRPKGPTWFKDGSLQVVRRLRQDVWGWNDALEREATTFTPSTFPAERLGECLVGRQKNGEPLARGQNPVTGSGPDGNDFTYQNDPEGRQTPCAAHIRRTHPRYFTNPKNRNDQSRRIMRRGIPYGPVAGPRKDKDKVDRGLMFVCYGTSLEQQFEFVQEDWSNNPRFVPGERGAPNGIDKLIGILEEHSKENADADIKVTDGEGTVSMERFVRTTGAVYAFTPSISTLRRLAANKPLHENG